MAHQYPVKMNTSQKTAFKLDEKFKKIKFWKLALTFRPLSIKFIPETVKETGNPATHHRKLSTQFIQQKCDIKI